MDISEVKLPPHLVYSILEKCSINTIMNLAGREDSFSSLCKREDLMIKKFVEILILSGRKPNQEFLSNIKSRGYDEEHWKSIFNYLSPYIRWNSTPIYVDSYIPIKHSIDRVVLAKDEMMRIEVPGGFITYRGGEEIFVTPVQGLISRDSIHYTPFHIVAKLPGEEWWSLVEYSVDDETDMPTISHMYNLNTRVSNGHFLDVSTHLKHAVFLLSDRLVVYDWTTDTVVMDMVVYEGMAKIIPEFTSDGRIGRVILHDLTNRVYKVLDFRSTGAIVRLDVGKTCSVVVPLFKLDMIWTVDMHGNETCYSMSGTVTYRGVREKVVQASYIESVGRIITVTEAGKVMVGEVSDKGKFVDCGTLDYGSSPSFLVSRIVSGQSDITLIGDKCLRYISFMKPQ